MTSSNQFRIPSTFTILANPMSMELYVLLHTDKLPSVAEWQDAIRSHEFDLVLDHTLDLRTHEGFTPAAYRGIQAGFELTVELATTITDMYTIPNAESYDTAVTFRWGSDLNECASAYIAAGVLALSTAGLLYDPQEDTSLVGEGAIDIARQVATDIEAT
jgi:hypothetical protein